MAIDCTRSGRTVAEDQANARLIAAAPDLMAACIAFVKAYTEKIDDYDSLNVAEDHARAAIAKATGV